MEKVSLVINRISKALQKAELALGSLCLFALLFIMLLNVFMRYILAKPLFWADEINNFLFVWFALLGVSYIMGNNGHLRVTSLTDKLPERTRGALAVAVNLIMGAMFVTFALSSFRLLAIVTYSGILRIPLKYIYAILPLSFGLMSFHILNNILKQLWPADAKAPAAQQAVAAEKGE